jgi:DNA integrity scanning protein DisA with diadenylate cyclase activity
VLFYLPLAVIVLFQQDLRRILSAVGQTPLVRLFAASSSRQVLVNDLVLACRTLRARRYGALIVIERGEGCALLGTRLCLFLDGGLNCEAD